MTSKIPTYSGEKRAKFAGRENKQWIRFATVIGYICSVCLPAIALSIYYVGFWDPQYKEKFPPNSTFMSNAHGVQRTFDSSIDHVHVVDPSPDQNPLAVSQMKSGMKEEREQHQGNLILLPTDTLKKDGQEERPEGIRYQWILRLDSVKGQGLRIYSFCAKYSRVLEIEAFALIATFLNLRRPYAFTRT
ncbi:hypothetical protein M514_26537, partial [Trichuris suis]